MNTILSIDLGSHTIHMAEGIHQKHGTNVWKTASFPVPEGCLLKETVTYPQLLADAIESYAKSSGFQAKEVVLTMNGDFALVRDLDLPIAKPKELEGMIRHGMTESFYISQDDVLQYKEIDRVMGDAGETLVRYRVIAIDRELIEGYYEVLKLTKLKVRAMDLNLNAIDKVFASANSINGLELRDQATLLIDYGHSGMTLYVISKGKPLFFRRLSIGSGEIDQVLSDVLKISVSEARGLKEKETSFFNNDEKTSPIFAELNPYFNRFNDEVRKVISFYNNRAGSTAIGQVFLFGNGSKLAGLSENLSSNLGLPVELVRSIDTMKVSGDGEIEAGSLNAIGALIRFDK